MQKRTILDLDEDFEKEYEDGALKKYFAPEFRNRLDGTWLHLPN